MTTLNTLTAPTMTPNQVTDLLAQVFRQAFTGGGPTHHVQLLLTGAPGIGKSDLVAQAVQQTGAYLPQPAKLLIFHPAVSDPSHFQGLPFRDAAHPQRATFLPYGDWANVLEATEPTVVFLDDLGQATPAVQAALMQPLRARSLNGQRIPDCVYFLAATNRRTDRAGVTGLLEPVKSRFAAIIEIAPSLDDFKSWWVTQALPPEPLAYLNFRPDHLCVTAPTADLSNSPNPRTWEAVGRILALRPSLDTASTLYGGAVGHAVGSEFAAFLTLAQTMPDPDWVLKNPHEEYYLVSSSTNERRKTLPERPDVCFALMNALAFRAAKKTFPALAIIINRLCQMGQEEYAVLLLRDSYRRCPQIAAVPEYAALATGPLGKLLLPGT